MYDRDVLAEIYSRSTGCSREYAQNVVQSSQINDYERIYNEKDCNN